MNGLLGNFQKRILNYGDAPEYEKNINLLMSYSAAQTYILNVWKLPHVTSNPSLQSWTFDGAENERVIVTWCTNICHYIVMEMKNSSVEWEVVRSPKNLEYFNNPDGDGRQPLLGGDARIYVGLMILHALRIHYIPLIF